MQKLNRYDSPPPGWGYCWRRFLQHPDDIPMASKSKYTVTESEMCQLPWSGAARIKLAGGYNPRIVYTVHPFASNGEVGVGNLVTNGLVGFASNGKLSSLVLFRWDQDKISYSAPT